MIRVTEHWYILVAAPPFVRYVDSRMSFAHAPNDSKYLQATLGKCLY